jgi:endonuclease G
VTVELWCDSADELEVALVHPRGATSPWVTRTTPTATGHFFHRTRYDVTYVRRHQDNGDSRVVATLRPFSSGIDAGEWTLQIRSPVVRSPTGTVHAWIERQGGVAQFATFLNEEITLTIPGTADTVIAVGSVASELPYQIADYSCFGPTRDGRQKPDVAAPGEDIVAADAGTPSGVRAASGTSVAAPHVTGAIALLLSHRAKLRRKNRAVEQLNANQIKKILAQSAQNFGGNWNPGLGFGVLDVAAALREASAI